VVSEGRLEDGDGLTLLELAYVMESLGCDDAYNLDGGSSTTLYFNGKVLNELPKDKEREVSDCIFINGLSYSEEVLGK
jgi:exopolysaccharide biosynthesis protein